MLTDAEIVRAIKSGANKQLTDKRGTGRGTGRLVLIVRSGRAEWYAQQWMNGTKRLSKIGSYPSVSLAKARERFSTEYVEPITNGTDIRTTRTIAVGTVQHLFEGYVEWLKAAGKRSAYDAELCLNTALTSLDKRILARDIKTDQILAVLRPIYGRGSKVRACHVRGYIRSAFEWGIRADNDYRQDKPKRFLISTNPAASIPIEPKKAGDRWLSVEELRTFWRWLHDTTPYNAKAGHGMVESNLQCLRVMVLCGQRVEMITRLSADQYNGEVLEWQITKNGKPHVMPVPQQAHEIIRSRMQHNHKWLFPSVFNPSTHVRNELMQAIVARFCERSGVNKFVPRDLRRTWKTLAGHAGITKTDRDLLQQHSRSDVSSRHYDRYEYLDEKRAAMARWSEWFRTNIEA